MVTARQISDYLDVLRVERGLAPATIAAYRRDLEQYRRFLVDRSPDTELVSAFVAGLAARGLATTTIARKIAAVRGLHRFLLAEGEASSDPTALLEGPRRGRPLPKALGVDEVLAVLESPDPATKSGIRDSAVLEFLYSTAARVSEAVALDELDIDLTDAAALLTGKGDRQRVVPLGRPAQDALARWMPQRATMRTPAAGGAVFLNMRGGRLSRQSMWSIVKKHATRAGVPAARISPHVLRHSAATHMVEGGADLRTVQELLGHATIATTQIYTRVSPQHLLEVFATAHPRS